MPRPEPNETKKHYIDRCIPEVMREGGHTTEQAAGKCYGMWKTYHKAKKAIKQGKALEVG